MSRIEGKTPQPEQFENILKLKKRINEQIDEFLKTSKIDVNELGSNINTINIYLSDIINSNIKKAIEQKNKTDKRFAFVIKASVLSIIVVFIFSITLMILIVANLVMNQINLIIIHLLKLINLWKK